MAVRASVFVAAGTAIVVGGMAAVGCGSVECWETATCAASDSSVAGDDAQGGAEGSPGGDDGTGNDDGMGGDQTVGPTQDATVDRSSDVAADTTIDVAADSQLDAGGDAEEDSALDAAGQDGSDAATADAADATPDAPPATCVCVPAVPTGWSGPVAVWEQSADAAPPMAPACPPTYPTPAFSGSADPSSPPASCQCTCEGPCTLQVSTYTNNNCGGTHLCATTPVSKSCVPGLGSCAVMTAKITTSVAFTGCDAGVAKSVGPYAWGTAAGACIRTGAAYVQGPCEAGQVCVDTAPPAFTRGLCVYQAGAASCPDSGYPVAYAYYGDAGDSRDCDASACQCTGPASSTCGASNVTLSSAADCSGGATLGGSCGTPFPITSSPYIGASITSSAGSCAQAGTAVPVGAVTPNAPTTVCCPN